MRSVRLKELSSPSKDSSGGSRASAARVRLIQISFPYSHSHEDFQTTSSSVFFHILVRGGGPLMEECGALTSVSTDRDMLHSYNSQRWMWVRQHSSEPYNLRQGVSVYNWWF